MENEVNRSKRHKGLLNEGQSLKTFCSICDLFSRCFCITSEKARHHLFNFPFVEVAVLNSDTSGCYFSYDQQQCFKSHYHTDQWLSFWNDNVRARTFSLFTCTLCRNYHRRTSNDNGLIECVLQICALDVFCLRR